MLLLSSHAQAAASASPLKDLLVAAGKGRLHEVQSLLDGGKCKVNDENEVCTSRSSCIPCISRALRVPCGLCLMSKQVRVIVVLDGTSSQLHTYVHLCLCQTSVSLPLLPVSPTGGFHSHLGSSL